MFIQSTAMGLSVGAHRCFAKIGEARLGRLVATTACFFTVVIFILIIVVSILLDFELLGAQENVRNLATSYVDLWFIGLPFFAFAMVGSSLMRAMGDIARPGHFMALAALLQIVFAPALIFGVNGFRVSGCWRCTGVCNGQSYWFRCYIYLFYKDKF